MLKIYNKDDGKEKTFGLSGALLFGGTLIAVDKFKDVLFHFGETMKNSRLYSCVLAPVNIAFIFSFGRQFVFGDPAERIDAGLGLIGESSSLSWNTASSLNALRDLHAVGRWSVSWAQTLMVISVPLQAGLLVYNMRLEWKLHQCIEGLGLYKRVWNEGDVAKLKEHLEDKVKAEFFKKHFQIQSEGSLAEMIPSLDLSKAAIFKKRAWNLQLSSRLRLLSSVVILVASIIMVTNPFSAAIFILYIAGMSLGIASMVTDSYGQQKFATAMRLPEENILVVRAMRAAKEKFHEIDHTLDHCGGWLKARLI